MALLDASFPEGRLEVDALDISARALARAKRGMYGINSFRGVDLTFRDRYFQPTANGYCLSDRISRIVNFSQRNILSADLPCAGESYDIIFCRNLLIYFDRSTQERAMRTLGRLLAPAGFLFVGTAEAFLAARSGFTSVSQSLSGVFRKAAAKCSESTGSCRVLAKKPVERLATLRAQRPKKPDPVPTPILVTPAPPISLETARALADAGRLAQAADLCEGHLRQHGPSSEAYYLLGVIQDALGERERAADYYRKVVYLKPDHADALIHLAFLIDRQGDSAGAQRLRARARRVQTTVEQPGA
jgi:chemotaxis protein methyltransferase WspC